MKNWVAEGIASNVNDFTLRCRITGVEITGGTKILKIEKCVGVFMYCYLGLKKSDGKKTSSSPKCHFSNFLPEQVSKSKSQYNLKMALAPMSIA